MKKRIKKIWHYLFKCPTFWQWKRNFTCPDCGKKYRCYWDGHDCECGQIHLCGGCAFVHKYDLGHAIGDL